MAATINLVVEDALSEGLIRAILIQTNSPLEVGAVYGKRGNNYIRQKLGGFNAAAKQSPYLILTDLDSYACPPELIKDWWQGLTPNRQLLFRIAVRETEAWLLAHTDAFARYLGISEALLPRDIDAIPNPKQALIALARKSPRRNLREAIVPKPNSPSQIGPDYNAQLVAFIYGHWRLTVAERNSESLRRCNSAIASLAGKTKN